MKGRKPKPIERQIIEGDPKKRGVHKLEEKLKAQPKASAGLPPCPAHLKGRSRAAWKFWAEELADMKLDKRPDGPMLEGACRSYERAVTADIILDEEGLIVKDLMVTEEGETITLRTKKHPAVEISNAAWTMVKSFCSEFGLSPVSRIRLTVDKVESSAEDDLLKLLSQPRHKVDNTLVQ